MPTATRGMRAFCRPCCPKSWALRFSRGHERQLMRVQRDYDDGPMSKSSRKEYVWLAVVAAVLIAAVFVVRANADPIKGFIERYPLWGAFLYILLNILDAVLAPGATLPLIPVAVHAWGRVIAALVTTIGWTTGSLIAFLVARRWGYPIVKRLTSMQRVRQMERYIPDDLFWSIVVLRLVLPMDV